MAPTSLSFISGLLLFLAGCAAPSYERGLAAFEREDYASALEDIEPLAEAGHLKSQLAMGLMYESGLGVEQDSEQSLIWLEKAARQGSALAQFAMGNRLALNGKDAEALEWFRMAAAQQLPLAQSRLGIMYEAGWGVEADAAIAAEWFGKAADLGLSEAQWQLALLYSKGKGVPKNDRMALMWLLISSVSGDPIAWDLARQLETSMSPAEVAAARSMALERLRSFDDR